MIIVRLFGGLGNQLFQYAAARALAERYHTELKCDVSWFDQPDVAAQLTTFARPLELGHFCTSIVPATTAEIRRLKGPWRRNRMVDAMFLNLWKLIGIECTTYFQEEIELYDPRWRRLSNNVYLEGYWQSPYYFIGIEDAIRREFQLADDATVRFAADYLETQRKRDCPLVAVHVRRGDLAYANEVLRRPGLVHGPLMGADYFLTAMGLLPEEAIFLVFSDGKRDVEWCRSHLAAKRAVFVEGHTAVQDFAIMQGCDHQIISNSTFSWWAAWLNRNPNKRVVAPRQWFHDSSVLRAPLECLIPREWMLI